jgi:hypothetical protein
MIFSKKDDSRNKTYKELSNQISTTLDRSHFQLKSLQTHPNNFGNAVVEITNGEIIVRFIQDRGDIYRDERHNGSEQWFDEQLVYSHFEPRNGVYELLIKSIDNFLNE